VREIECRHLEREGGARTLLIHPLGMETVEARR
jgi:hypothetical protein